MADKGMEREVNLSLLKYAVGRAIFCPDCERSLDYKHAVLVTGPGKNGIACVKCWETRKAALVKKHGAEVVEVVRKHGPEAVELIKSHGAEALNAIQTHGPAAIKFLQENGAAGIEAIKKFGPAALKGASGAAQDDGDTGQGD